MPAAPLADWTMDMWARSMALNLQMPFLITKAAAPHLARSSNPSVIFTSSTGALRGHAGMPAYHATKTGLLGLARSLADELGPLNIRVNCILPGWIKTPFNDPYWDYRPDPVAAEAALEASIPMRRQGTPEEVAGAGAVPRLAAIALCDGDHIGRRRRLRSRLKARVPCPDRRRLFVASAPVLQGVLGAVSAAHPLAVAAGQELLLAGGSAADDPRRPGGAVRGARRTPAASAATCSPWCMRRRGRPVAVNAAGARRWGWCEASGDGANSITVPGIVDGWRKMSRQWGRLPLARCLAPAVRIARAGFRVAAEAGGHGGGPAAAAGGRRRSAWGLTHRRAPATCSARRRWRA